jgi:hypothetical protein
MMIDEVALKLPTAGPGTWQHLPRRPRLDLSHLLLLRIVLGIGNGNLIYYIVWH